VRGKVLAFGVLALGLSVSSAACSRHDAGAGAGAVPRRSLGNVMADVARRFELAGKAVNVGRFELAAFEAGELEELFEDDVPHAELPKEGPTAQIPGLARAFRDAAAPELRRAALARDPRAFAAALARASAACNGCHRASEKAFIVVPSEPGRAVPELGPLPAASASP
jgi:hypothetical protein